MASEGGSILFRGTDSPSAAAELGWTLVRVFAGLSLALNHGLGKIPPAEGFVGMVGTLGFPAPELVAWLSPTAEFLGGLLLALGLLTRPAALLVSINMFVAVVFWHILEQGDAFGDYQRALFYLVIAVAFALAGSGRYSVDARLRRSREGSGAIAW